MNKPIDIRMTYMPSGSDASRQRTDDVAAKLDIVARATAAGRKNEPPTGEKQLDTTERQLVDESEGFIAAASRVAASEINTRADLMRSCAPAALETALEQAAIKRQAAEAEERYGSDLERAHANRDTAWRDLRGFEEDNGLAPQSAIYKTDALMFWTSLVTVILGEAAGNAFLLAELQERGLIGGLMLAGGIGVANVLLGLATGFLGWRLMTHVTWGRKLLGLALSSLFMNAALAMHLALGALREAITHDTEARIDFLLIFKPWLWFNYTSIPPFVLFAIGMAIFVVAALKGRGGTWGLNAPYWGHDLYDRRFRAADAELQDSKENYKDAVQNAYDGERSSLRARLAEGTASLTQLRRLAHEAQGIASTLGDSIQAEIGRNHGWLRAYRDANRAVRTTKPPTYFATYPSFEAWRSQRLDLSEIIHIMDAAERRVAGNAAAVVALEAATLSQQTAVIDRAMAKIGERQHHAEAGLARDADLVRPRTA